MRCASYCVGDRIDIAKAVDQLVSNGLEPQYFDDVIYFKKSVGNRVCADVFYFPFGSVIIWGASEGDEKVIIEELDNAVVDPYTGRAMDVLYCSIQPEIEQTYIDEEKNEIVLSSDSVFIKLSISHAMAQSVKLNTLEESVSKLMAKTAPLNTELSQTGSVSLSKTEISKQIGSLFYERYAINLCSDILDTPEFFWRRPRYEPLYLTTAEFYDIQKRHNIMNHRLDMIQEMYTMLSQEYNHKHSTHLEIIVILLISIEVVLVIMELMGYK